METPSSKPNTKVALTFEETINEEEGITFLNIYISKEADGREINAELIAHGEPTIAEQWGHEMLGFVEDYLRRQLNNNDLKGFMLTMPKKKDMN